MSQRPLLPTARRTALIPLALALPSTLAVVADAAPDDIGFATLRAAAPDLPTGENLTLLVGDFTSANTNHAWAVEPVGSLAGQEIRYLPPRARPRRFSPHATGVASTIAGSVTGILPQLSAITSVHSEFYCSDVLRVATGIAPEKPRWDLEVHTWNWTDETYSIELIRRMDWQVDHEGVTVVEALSNGRETKLPFVFVSGYNVITVGVATGTHSSGTTVVEGAGRTKPDLVAPTQYTSGATPLVAAGAGLLLAKAKLDPALAAASDPRVVKALLLAGAAKDPISSWTHTATQPLDEHYGAGQLDVAASYGILAGGRRPPEATGPTRTGWDRGTSGGTTYRFEVPDGELVHFSAVLTWHRQIVPDSGWTNFASDLPALDLRLSSVNDAGAPLRPVAESRSPLDNVEHIYLPTLPPGRYELAVTGAQGVAFGLAWRCTPGGGSAPTPPPTPTSGASRFSVGMTGDAVLAVAGRPAEVKPFRHKALRGEIWTYLQRRAIHERPVPKGYREIRRSDPLSGTTSKANEPIEGVETTYLHETTDLLLLSGKVAELQRHQRVTRDVR